MIAISKNLMLNWLTLQLPDDLPFEDLLITSSKLYDKYSLTVIEKKVEELIKIE